MPTAMSRCRGYDVGILTTESFSINDSVPIHRRVLCESKKFGYKILAFFFCHVLI
jgi:hypothetical protein